MKSYTSDHIKRWNHLFWEIDAVYHEMSVKLGMSDSSMAILYTICDNGDSCLLREICRRSGMSKQTVNSAIRKLEREGIVCLEAVDAKSKNVCLTDKGRAVAQRTAVRIIETENAIFDSWTEEEREKYLELTERFLMQLGEKAKQL